MAYREYNFDGLVGPTHNYAGLGTGNLASIASKHHVSSPKAAALEGLAKMKSLAELGVPQAVLPPQRRPHVGYLLARYGARDAWESPRPRGPSERAAPNEVTGRQAVADAALEAAIRAVRPDADPWHLRDRRPKIDEVATLLRNAAENGAEGRRDLAIASSASAMWAANAATVSPSPDTADGRLHLTPANLVSQPHRALEAPERHRILAHIFGDATRFAVHAPLSADLPDEGAANHTRLCPSHGRRGAELFTYGRRSTRKANDAAGRFRPRQLLEASVAVAANHQLGEVVPRFVGQCRQAIDAGVFHNDVIAVGNEQFLLVHESAWCDFIGRGCGGSISQVELVEWLPRDLRAAHGGEFLVYETSADELPLPDAVRSYLFNSQLVTFPDGTMALIYPAECDEVPSAKTVIERILRENNPVEKAVRVDVRQSMKNGGGPACLRLRVVLSDEERAAVRGNVFWTPRLHETLVAWVYRHYRETLAPSDLTDVRLYEESMAALDDLAEILQLPI